MTRPITLVAGLFVATVTLACGGSDAPKIPLAQGAVTDSARAVEAAHGVIGPAARAALDSGNAFYRKKDYTEALVHYRSASELAPQHPAPFFGIYMVGRAINDRAMADSALAAIRVRNGPMTPVPHTTSDSAVRRMHEVIRSKSTTGGV
jgi:hypothetical protein